MNKKFILLIASIILSFAKVQADSAAIEVGYFENDNRIGQEICSQMWIEKGYPKELTTKYCPRGISRGYAIGFAGHIIHRKKDSLNSLGEPDWYLENVPPRVSEGFGIAFYFHRQMNGSGTWALANIPKNYPESEANCFAKNRYNGKTGQASLDACLPRWW